MIYLAEITIYSYQNEMDKHKLERVIHFKDLGITYDSKLTSDLHNTLMILLNLGIKI